MSIPPSGGRPVSYYRDRDDFVSGRGRKNYRRPKHAKSYGSGMGWGACVPRVHWNNRSSQQVSRGWGLRSTMRNGPSTESLGGWGSSTTSSETDTGVGWVKLSRQETREQSSVVDQPSKNQNSSGNDAPSVDVRESYPAGRHGREVSRPPPTTLPRQAWSGLQHRSRNMWEALRSLQAQPEIETENKGYQMFKKCGWDKNQILTQPIVPTVTPVVGGGLGSQSIGAGGFTGPDITEPVCIVVQVDGTFEDYPVPTVCQGAHSTLAPLQWAIQDAFPHVFGSLGVECKLVRVRNERLDLESELELSGTEFSVYVCVAEFRKLKFERACKRKGLSDNAMRSLRYSLEKKWKTHKNLCIDAMFQVECFGPVLVCFLRKCTTTSFASKTNVFQFGVMDSVVFGKLGTRNPQAGLITALTPGVSLASKEINKGDLHTQGGRRRTDSGYEYNPVVFRRATDMK